jgi:hypothetical protein
VSRPVRGRNADGESPQAPPTEIDGYAALFDMAWFLSPRPTEDAREGAQETPVAKVA